MMKYSIILSILLYFCLCNVDAERTLHYEVNPGCGNLNITNCKDSTLVYTTSSNLNGTYHYVWSFINSFTPAVFIFASDNRAKLNIDWKRITFQNESSFNFTDGTVYNSLGLELSRLYFVNQTNNNTLYTIPLEDINWTNSVKAPKDSVAFTFTSTNKELTSGEIIIKLSVFDQEGRSDEIPRLQYLDSSNLFQVTLNNISAAANKTDQPRLVCDLTVAFEGTNVDAKLHESVTIDDEYTPGVFQSYVYKLSTESKQSKMNSNETAYVQWKPVAYFDDSKTIAKSIKVTQPTIKKDSLKRSILNAYFAGKSQVQVDSLKSFMFSIPDDEFDYEKNKYIQFSLAVGLNEAPVEGLSLTLKIIIIAGLGLPMILFLISIVYTVIHKLRSPNNDFSTLTEDTS